MHYATYKSVLSPKNGMNIYRGCSHGCIYCDSRSICYQMNHDFEDIEVKKDAPLLLENALKSRRKPCMIGTGSMCDPYMHIEKELLYTRRCLELILRYGFGVTMITKSDLILRDLDLLKAINQKTKCVVQMTLTTFDEALCKKIEPNVAGTKRRYEVLKILHDEGIPTVVWMCPFLPFINDTEENLQGLLKLCFDAKVSGILNFGIGLTLREGNREYFYKKLDEDFPTLKEKYISAFGESYSCESPESPRLMKIFHTECEKMGIMHNVNEIFNYLSEFPETLRQESLFD